MAGPQQKDKIIIAGAGPVGLAAALRLAHLGHKVDVYEARDDIPMSNDNSYPIGVNPRGQDGLRRINPKLVEDLNRVGMRINAWEIYSGTRMVAGIKSGTVIGTTRADVNMILFEECKGNPNINVIFGHKLEAIDFDTKQLVFEPFGGGEKVTVDGSTRTRVIAADGIWSKCRREMERQDTSLKVEQGNWGVNFRVIFSKKGASTPKLDPGVHYIMNECYVATVKDGQWVVSLTLKDAHADTADYKMLVSDDPSDENVALLKKYVASRAPPAAAILEDEDYRKFFTRAKFCGAVTRCSKFNHGEFLLLLGDAAHSVIPPTGEGVNSGLEDTRYLAEAFENDPTTPFATYNAQRAADIHELGEYAWHCMEDLRGVDPAKKAASVMYRIASGTARKIGLKKSTVEEELFGEMSSNYTPYSDCLGRWHASKDTWIPRFYKIAKLFS